jgi:hypothetical protein
MIYDILSLTNSTLVTADMILLCTKEGCPQLIIFIPLSIEKRKTSALLVPPLSSDFPYTHLYFPNTLLQFSMSLPYTGSWHSTCQTSFPFSGAKVVPENPPLYILRNKYKFLRCGVASPPPNTQAGGPPHVGCPRLLIQYIWNYSVADRDQRSNPNRVVM